MIPTSPVQPKEALLVDDTEDDDEEEEEEVEEENEEQRIRREEEESIALARILMEEEAALAYHHQLQMLRENPEHLSEEDLAVFREMEERDRLEAERERTAGLEDEDDDDEEELSYDALLNLGERIGDVRTERWALVAQQHIDRLPLETYDTAAAHAVSHNDDSEVKCLVCQLEYQDQELLRRLPCGHVFHAECVDQWLATHDNCLYCRKCIVDESSES